MARDFIKEVDNKASQADADGKPLFGPTRSAVQELEELARMFERRRIPPSMSKIEVRLTRSRHH